MEKIHADDGSSQNIPKGTDQIRSMICERCWKGLFASASFKVAFTSRSIIKGYNYQEKWTDVEQSAKDGCSWCKIVLRDKEGAQGRFGAEDDFELFVTSGVGTITKLHWNADDGALSPGDHKTLRLIFRKKTEKKEGEPDISPFGGDEHDGGVYDICTEADDPASRYISVRNPILDLSSPLCFQLAKRCLEECLSEHEKCPKPQETALPSRVIDCSDPEKPKILITEGLGIKAHYAALSYVWGEPQPHKTVTDNLHVYSSCIDLELQPKTIKDAIKATHEFGLQYLWIDALCILQDSRDDKDKEIPQMRRIFNNAYLTIIAASSEKASEGFLHDRPARSTPIGRIPYVPPEPKEGESGPARELGTIVLMTQYEDTDEPVDARAWCLEERLLSHRSFMYASDTLRYHCQKHTVAVSGSLCCDIRRLHKTLNKPGINDDYADWLVYEWNRIVTDYTERHVTEPIDKLIAIAGIAEKVQPKLRKGYVAGLWECRLLDELLWRKDAKEKYKDHAARPKEYRAPSWSWAAVDGRVSWPHLEWIEPDFEEIAEALESNALPSQLDHPFGAVSGGTVKLKGHMNRVTWNPGEKEPRLFRLAKPEDEAGLSPTDKSLVLCAAFPDSLDETSMPVGHAWAMPFTKDNDYDEVVGLILVPDKPDDTTIFRRVGFFSHRDIWKRGEKSRDWTEEGPMQTITLV